MVKLMKEILSPIGLSVLNNSGFFLFLVAIATLLTYLCRRYLKIMDYANDRSLHEGAIPRSGGIAIVMTFCIGILVYYFVAKHYFIPRNEFWGLLIAAIVISVVSLYDDISSKGMAFKLISQLMGVAVLIGFGLTINEWTIPIFGKISFGIYGYIITILWIVGITNAYNFMDGLNGLAAGVAIIVSIALAFICFNGGSWFVFHIAYIITACCLGFIFFN